MLVCLAYEGEGAGGGLDGGMRRRATYFVTRDAELLSVSSSSTEFKDDQ